MQAILPFFLKIKYFKQIKVNILKYLKVCVKAGFSQIQNTFDGLQNLLYVLLRLPHDILLVHTLLYLPSVSTYTQCIVLTWISNY